MSTQIDRISDGLKKAMKAEHDGHFFYKSAAANTADQRGKEVFEMLATEEKDHFNFLKAQFDSFQKTGSVDTTLELKDHSSLSPDSPIFSPEIKNRIRDASYEMSALSIGIKLEQSSIDFYTAEAEAVDDPDVKQFYTRLASWEHGHLNALIRQEESLKEDYWYETGFAPF